MKPTPEQVVAKKIVRELIFDLNDRSGFETHDIDRTTMKEWKTEWELIVIEKIEESGGLIKQGRP